MERIPYRVAATPLFLRELKDYRKRYDSIRAHLDSFVLTAHDPFSREKSTEKLNLPRKFGDRWSMRLNDDFRVIFDMPESDLIVYRTVRKHQGAYHRAVRLGRVDISNSVSFPWTHYAQKSSETSSIQPTRLASRRILEQESLALDSLGTGKHEHPQTVTAPEVNISSQVSDDSGLPESEDMQEALINSLPLETCVVFQTNDDIRNAMNGSLEEWMLFLPAQHRQLVIQRVNGPSRVFGASGTGKTCILLHRAVYLARTSCEDVLVLTFKSTLVGFLSGLLDRLCAGDSETRKRIQVRTVMGTAEEIAMITGAISTNKQHVLIKRALKLASLEPTSLSRKFRKGQTLDDFTVNEITQWVKGAARGDREDYETFSFPSGKTALSPSETEWIFQVLDQYERLKEARWDDQDVLRIATERLAFEDSVRHSAVLVDEFQDLDLCALRFVKALCKTPENLYFAGDHRQRIYRTLPSFEKAGISIRGRSREVTLNYRNSPEIYAAAEAVLNGTGHDPDGEDGAEILEFAQSSQEKPTMISFQTEAEEAKWVQERVREMLCAGVALENIAIISLNIEQSRQIDWDPGFKLVQLDPERVNRLTAFTKGYVKRMTIHQSKGFEFPIVFMVGLAQHNFQDSEFIRLQEDETETVRALLYVGMTRARNRLFLSSPGPLLELLADVRPGFFA